MTMNTWNKLAVSWTLGLVLLSTVSVTEPCIICVGDPQNEICILPGCTPPGLLDLEDVLPWASSGTLADQPEKGLPRR